jgi:hypothetical protein
MQHWKEKSFAGVFYWQWLLLASHLALYFYWRDNSVFYWDDGVWLARVQEYWSEGWSSIAHLWPWEQGRQLRRHPTLAAYLHMIFFSAGQSSGAVLTGITFLHAAVQFVILRFCNRRGQFALGVFVCLLYFWTPSMQAYYGLRFWQIVYLPIVGMLFVLKCISHAESGDPKELFLAAVWAAVATLFHGTAACLFVVPAVFFLLHDRKFPLHKISTRDYGIACAALWVALTPWWVPLAKIYGWRVALSMLPIALLIGLRKVRVLEFSLLVVLIGVAIAGILYAPKLQVVVDNFSDLLSAPNAWLRTKGGFTVQDWYVPSWANPVSLLWLVCMVAGLVRWKHISSTGRALLWINLAPLALIILAHGAYRVGPHQYVLFLLPGAWMALGWFLIEEKFPVPMPARRSMALVAILACVAASTTYHGEVRRFGGRGQRCSTYGEKLAAVEQVTRSTEPVVIVQPQSGAFTSCTVVDAWKPLFQQKHWQWAPQATEPASNYNHISEPYILNQPPTPLPTHSETWSSTRAITITRSKVPIYFPAGKVAGVPGHPALFRPESRWAPFRDNLGR